MKRILSCLFIITTFGLYVSAQSPDKILYNTVDKLSQSTGTVVSFTIKADGEKQDGMAYIKGDKFAIVTKGGTTVYDGKNLWTINKNVKEINVYTPESEELNEINPLRLLSGRLANFTVKFKNSSETAYNFNLIPKNDEVSIKDLWVNISNVGSHMPVMLRLNLLDGTWVTVNIVSIKLNQNISKTQFVVNKKNYSSYKLIDMR